MSWKPPERRDAAGQPAAQAKCLQTVQRADVAHAYGMFLGRPPENEAALLDKVGESREGLIRRFIESEEFDEKVYRRVCGGQLPAGPVFDEAPSPPVLAWAAEFLPLSESACRRLPKAASWASAFRVIFSDEEFSTAFPTLRTLFPPGLFSDRLEALSASIGSRVIVGGLDEAESRLVRGWALDRAAPQTPVGVELWLDGQFVAARQANEFRRDLQDRLETEGLHGFTFQDFGSSEGMEDRSVRLQVRESGSKALIGAKTISIRPERDADLLAGLARQVADARASLDRVEKLLREVRSSFGYTLSNYDDYYRSYYVETPGEREAARREAQAFSRRLRFTVFIVPGDGDAPILETLDSLKPQIFDAFDTVVVTFRSALGSGPGAGGDPARETSVREVVLEDQDACAAALTGDFAVLLTAGDRLAPDALFWFCKWLQTSQAELLYPDADTVSSADRGASTHSDPALRPAFDWDLLLQTPYFGECVVVGAERLRARLRSGLSLAAEARAALILDLVDGGDLNVEHVSRVLHHRAPRPDGGGDYGKAVEDYLRRSETAAEVVTASSDPQERAASFRLQWPLPSSPSTCVIIPTRDRLDLLGPCLASVLGSKGANQTDMEVIVVDNASSLATTQRFLSALDVSGQIRLAAYDGVFNWSAINNYAARLTEADVLIFLNNDTVVLTPDWCDELCRQAFRPAVGAVGARLLYEDGSVQHAGVILGAGESLIAHEGLGSPLREPGYLGRRLLVHQSAAVTGACLATRRRVFESLGGFDEDQLAVEANDIDYCLRVRRAGLKVIYDPHCTLYHFESKSRGQTSAEPARLADAHRQLALMDRRWGADLHQDPFYNAHFDRRSRPFTRLGPPPLTLRGGF